MDLLVVAGAVGEAGETGSEAGKGGGLGLAGDIVRDGIAELLVVRDGGEAGVVRVVLGVRGAGASSSASSSISSPSLWAPVVLAIIRHLWGSYLRNYTSY